MEYAPDGVYSPAAEQAAPNSLTAEGTSPPPVAAANSCCAFAAMPGSTGAARGRFAAGVTPARRGGTRTATRRRRCTRRAALWPCGRSSRTTTPGVGCREPAQRMAADAPSLGRTQPNPVGATSRQAARRTGRWSATLRRYPPEAVAVAREDRCLGRGSLHACVPSRRQGRRDAHPCRPPEAVYAASPYWTHLAVHPPTSATPRPPV